MEISGPLLVIDFQEKLVSSIHDFKDTLRNAEFLIKAFKLIGKPIFYTEQNPKGLGQTIPELKTLLEGNAIGFEKLCFSSVCDAVSTENAISLSNFLESYRQLVICGIETHICVFQTVYDSLKSGFEVFLAVDACGSIRKKDHETAVETMRSLGAIVLPSISIVYATLGSSEHPKFREVLKLVKDYLYER
jgi:nicotinamidase-related amidase